MFRIIKKFFWIIVIILVVGLGIIIFRPFWKQNLEIRTNEEENDFRKQLETILTKISKPNASLWETQKSYQKSEDILLQVSKLKEIPNENQIIKLLGEIRAKFLFKLVEFCSQLEGRQIKLSNLLSTELIQLNECIQIGKEQSGELEKNNTYDNKTYHQIKTTLDNWQRKAEKELKKRADQN
jgi:hypothetical protein